MVTNVIAAPQHDVVSNFGERLKGIVFKNENVFTQFYVSPNESIRAHVRSNFVSKSLRFKINLRTKSIQFGVYTSPEERMF
jgi:hypothetical protein